MKCTALVADPPWKFGDKLPGETRGAEKNYATLTLNDIQRFSIPEMVEDSILFLWRVSSQVEEAYLVARTWGFEPKSEIVWVKTMKNQPPRELYDLGDSEQVVMALPKMHFGMGRTVRGAHETCIVCTRGSFKPASLSVRTVFFAPVQEHSRKPDKFYEIVDEIVWGKELEKKGERHIVEMFARRVWPGWECRGNELGETTVEQAAEAIRPGRPVYKDSPEVRFEKAWIVCEAHAEGELASNEEDQHGKVRLELSTSIDPKDRAAILARACSEGLVDISKSDEEAWLDIMYNAPPGWFALNHVAPDQIGVLAERLAEKGLQVNLLDLAQWEPIDRTSAWAWVQGALGHAGTPSMIAVIKRLSHNGTDQTEKPRFAPISSTPRIPETEKPEKKKPGRKKDMWKHALKRAEAEAS
jgi:N6-adenosine-specific RNA methylase IME4